MNIKGNTNSSFPQCGQARVVYNMDIKGNNNNTDAGKEEIELFLVAILKILTTATIQQ